MIGYYNYTVILTYVSLSLSVCGIILAVRGNIIWAIWILLACGFCDMFDGKIAGTKKDRTDKECRFGIQIDSLCDVVCFGVLPAAIGLGTVGDKVWIDPVFVFFVLCAVIRLAYFNVTEEERQEITRESRKYYDGLPVTGSAVILPLIYIIEPLVRSWFAQLLAVTMLAVAVLYILPVKIPKAGKITMAELTVLGLTEVIGLAVITF